MKKSLLTLSILSASLLASCAKSDAQVAFIKVKKVINESYIVKSWDSCEFARLDSKAYIKTLATDEAKEEVKARGNVVALHFTFTTMNNEAFNAYSVVDKKETVCGTLENANELAGYTKAFTTFTLFTATELDFVTTGNLIKVKKA